MNFYLEDKKAQQKVYGAGLVPSEVRYAPKWVFMQHMAKGINYKLTAP